MSRPEKPPTRTARAAPTSTAPAWTLRARSSPSRPPPRVLAQAAAAAALLALTTVPPASAQPSAPGFLAAARAEVLSPPVFPTDNDAVLRGEPAAFYMGLVRHFGAERVRTWEGGRYGYVRNAVETPVGWRFSRFHEGVDIAPLYRDESGEPLDEVRAVDAGRVVEVNLRPGGSDYGVFVVVEHEWGGSPFYTRYAHLASVDVYEGDRLRRGARLGVMGHTGEGLDRERAHLHFEVNLLLNEHFAAWRDARHPSWRATRGRFHGSNLAGLDPVELLMRWREGAPPAAAVVLEQVEEVTVLVPGGPAPDVLRRYPWLCRSCAGGEPIGQAASWEVGLTRAGLPVRVEPSDEAVSSLRLLRLAREVRLDYLPSRLLVRSGPGEALSDAGRAHLALLFARPGRVPAW